MEFRGYEVKPKGNPTKVLDIDIPLRLHFSATNSLTASRNYNYCKSSKVFNILKNTTLNTFMNANQITFK